MVAGSQLRNIVKLIDEAQGEATDQRVGQPAATQGGHLHEENISRGPSDASWWQKPALNILKA
jgi:hypothetical protein